MDSDGVMPNMDTRGRDRALYPQDQARILFLKHLLITLDKFPSRPPPHPKFILQPQIILKYGRKHFLFSQLVVGWMMMWF